MKIRIVCILLLIFIKVYSGEHVRAELDTISIGVKLPKPYGKSKLIAVYVKAEDKKNTQRISNLQFFQ